MEAAMIKGKWIFVLFQGRSNTCDDPTVPCVNNIRNSGTDPKSSDLQAPGSKVRDQTEFAASSQSVQSAECSGYVKLFVW